MNSPCPMYLDFAVPEAPILADALMRATLVECQ